MPVIGWRVSPDDGTDLLAPQSCAGRWHYAGSIVVYCSATPELAVLEALVHHRRATGKYYLQQVVCPRTPDTACIELDQLPYDWRHRPHHTRMLGHAWLMEAATACLRVPSRICPESDNLLINPSVACYVETVVLRRFRFDRRLLLRRS